MGVYLSILRGINVSGKKAIKMVDLKEVYQSIGFENITTYIQSGNVVFESDSDVKLVEKIEAAILKKYQFEVPILIRTLKEIENTISSNPFLKTESTEIDKFHVTFLGEQAAKENMEKTNAYNYSPDEFVLTETEVFVYCPNGYGKTKLNNTFFEKKLKVSCTTRNWKTCNKLLEIMKGY
jgi:uncharacterized protein (DUF1697 family)